MKKCKSCQTEIDDKAKKCPNCRADQRNWFVRHKIMTVLLAIIVIAIAASASGSKDKSDNKTSGNPSSQSQNKTYRFNDRADKQKKDVEIIPGETGTVDGRKLTVTKIERKTSLGEFSSAPAGKTYLVATDTIENTSDKVKTYNMFDFRVQTVSGQVLDVYFGGTNDLSSGDLVAGGKVSGSVTFETPIETAAQYIIYKPNSAMSDRIIVEAKQ